MNLHKPNRARLRVSHHVVLNEVDLLGRQLTRVSGRGAARHGGHKEVVQITLINCAGMKGSAVVGLLDGDRIFTRGGLFTALSAAIEGIIMSGLPFLLTSAMKFVHGLPASLISSFGDALSRAHRTSLLLRIISVSRPSFRRRVRMIRGALRRVKYSSGPSVVVFGGVSGCS